ncbi:MAG: FtsX-like permease family protein, partial [Anaerolineae bacterium]|nr:FtsX-like permease family protein [Anaerolineae bacterium]
MIAKYVWQGFKRHKVRTAIMVVALAFVATMLISLSNAIATSRRQMVDLVAQNTGEHDIVIRQTDTSTDPYLDIGQVSAAVRQAHPAVEAVHGRIQASVEIARGAQGGAATLLARDPQVDTLGSVQMIDGEYNLESDHVVVLQDTAQTYNLKVGDELYLNYLVPEARERGKESPANTSVRRRSHRFVVAGIATQQGLDGGLQNGILANLETVQGWLDIPGRAERLVVVLDPGAYDAASSRVSAVLVRRAAEQIRAALGDEIALTIPKAQAMTGSDSAFSIMQTLTIIYGFLSMGVVGLLVYSLINANVDDRRRDLAFMRILGAPQRSLFALVLIEVGLIGALGVGVGILIGQALSTLVVERVIGGLLPILMNGSGLSGLPAMDEIRLVVSPRSLLSTALIAGVVLVLSALTPALKAATTRVRYAIAPGSADSLQIEDLARLRVRRFDWKITVTGLTLTMMWGMLFLNQLLVGMGENESASVAFTVVGMILMILGVSLLFFVLTVPFERLLLVLMNLISPGLTFFSSRNVRRAKRRSTTITLMIVFSTTLPTFLGTTAALSSGNVAISTRQSNGAPVVGQTANTGMNIFMYFVGFFSSGQQQGGLKPEILSQFADVPGVEPVVGLTQTHLTEAHNLVQLLDVRLDVHAWTHSPLDVLYPDLTEMVGDGRAAFQQMFRQPDAI